MDTSVQDLLDLRSVSNDVERGFLFEQALRELVPWSFRPPLAMRAKSEQLDAFYEWNTWHFLMEAKAKEKPITRGSHDWEDFELKVRRRRGSCVGLYCSLFPVSKSINDAAEELNRNGFPTIVLAGKVWDQIAETQIPITDLMRYMVLHVKATHNPAPPTFSKVKEWCYDRGQLEKVVQSFCRSLSATFLRRHILPNHSQIYVRREIDRRIEETANLLRPSVLTQNKKTRRKHLQNQPELLEYTTERQAPPQICLIRDASGAGKTTLSLEIALTTEVFYGFARAASENNIDATLTSLEDIGPNSGLTVLPTLNKPLVFVVDSLDEALNVPGKHAEVLGLIRALEELNIKARSVGLMAYPILIIFTIREDYWRQWETIFEGRHAIIFRKEFSKFGPEEFITALDNYSKAYHYVIQANPGSEATSTLSLPFNLQIFSEANEYFETVSFADVFDEKVLQLYFNRKRDNIINRRVPGLTGEALIRLMSEFAMHALREKRRMVTRQEAMSIIASRFPNLYSVADEVLLACRSEEFISHDPHNPEELRFRHSRFLEYLTAQYIVRAYDEGRGKVEDLTGEVFESGTVSMYRVHDFVRFICHREFPHLFDRIMNMYAQSEQYMTGILTHLRSEIGFGVPLTEHYVSIIRRSLNSSSPRIAWDSFFALAAKINNVQDQWVLEAFEVAWKSNIKNEERWRILDRLTSRGLLLRGTVIERVLDSTYIREWEFILGTLLSVPQMRADWRDAFPELSHRVEETLKKRSGIEWYRIYKLWRVLVEGHEYIPGDI